MKVCFASHNKHKLAELAALLPPGIELIGLNAIGQTEEIEETGESLEENSRLKAKYVYDKFDLPVFADDSGLLVNALNGEPGVYSARYAGPKKDDEQNINLLLRNLANHSDRSAEFQTIITYLDEKGEEKQFKGAVKGEITKDKRGKHGFGYDPIFQPAGFDQTFAELSPVEKNGISHRAKAVQQLVEYIHQHHG